MKSNKTKVSILIGVLVILLLPLMAGCMSINDYYDCNTVIHEGELVYYFNGNGDSATFKDGFSVTAGYIYFLSDSGQLTAFEFTYGRSYKVLRCSKNINTLLLVPSNINNPTQYTPFNPQKDCDCDK